MYRIFNHLGDISGCTWYRNHLPTLHCREALRHHGIQLENKILFDGNTNYDCFIFSRLPYPKHFPLINRLYASGKKIIWDIDDELWNVPSSNDAHSICNDLKIWLPFYFNMSSAITTTNSYLAQSISSTYGIHINKLRILENLIEVNDFTKFQDPNKSFSDSKIKIMWSGSQSHAGDLGPIKVLFDYYRNNPDIIFLFFGYLPEEFQHLSPNDVLHIPYINKKYYEPVISLLSPHIALAPLDDTQFNRCKSPIKYLEFSLCNSVSLASNMAPYSDVIEDNHDGFLCYDVVDWIKYCDFIIDNREDARQIAINARHKVVSDYSWNTDNRRKLDWIDFFKSIPDL